MRADANERTRRHVPQGSSKVFSRKFYGKRTRFNQFFFQKPLNQPPLIQTPIPFYPDTNSPPLDNHYDLSDLPNGNENNLHDDTPITPPLALNKGKRKAASGMGILPLSTQINSIGEKAEKRPKRVVS